MAIQKPTKPTDLMPRTFGGIKNNFSEDLQSSGYEPNIKQTYNGDNLNYQLDATGKELDYCEKVVDFINSLPVNKLLYVNSNNQLDYIDKDDVGYSRQIGEYVWSSIPLVNAWLRLPDGAVLSGSGIYANFVEHIASLYAKYPSLFVSETDWQASVSQYGVCGKYVYNASANTVRLPKVTGFVEGTLDVNALGDLVEAGLPNITGAFNADILREATNVHYSGALAADAPWSAGTSNQGTDASQSGITFDASKSNAIYGKSNTVQPQSTKGFLYIVVATSTKTDIEVDIDNIATDLNNKVDISNMIELPIIPDYENGITVTALPYVAPSEGAIDIELVDIAQGTSLLINGIQVNYAKSSSNSFYTAISGQYRVCAGDIINAELQGAHQVQFCKFFPVKGV